MSRAERERRSREGLERLLALARQSRESQLTLAQRRANAYRGTDR